MHKTDKDSLNIYFSKIIDRQYRLYIVKYFYQYFYVRGSGEVLISGTPCGWFTSLGIGSLTQHLPSLVFIKESIILLYIEYTIQYLFQVTSWL